MIQGVITAMVTPFANSPERELDLDRLRQNVEWQISQGIDGLVPCGTTGESPTLSHEEQHQVTETVIDAAAGRVLVIAGTGSNSTDEALSLTRHAKDAGASAALMVNPYYNKPTQEGLYRHFMAVADAVELPIVLYNIPSRTNLTMSPATVARLSRHQNIVAVKEATGSLDIASEIASLCGPDFTILSGDDSLTLPLMSVGGSGVISVLSNLLPARIKSMVDVAAKGDFDNARAAHLALFPLFKAMFIETNPIPIKTAMRLMGMDTGQLRLPMCEMSEDNCAMLEKVMRENGVLEAVGSH